MLRGADAIDYLRLKSAFKPSDCNALFSDGRKLPVIIRPDSGQLAVEIEDRLFDPAKLPTFQKFELKPEEIVQPPPAPPEPTEDEIFQARLRAAREANPTADGWRLEQDVRAQLFREAQTQKYSARQQEQESSFGALPSKWAAFAEMNKRARNSR